MLTYFPRVCYGNKQARNLRSFVQIAFNPGSKSGYICNENKIDRTNNQAIFNDTTLNLGDKLAN